MSGFLFLGNQLALDFLNTRPIPAAGPVELLPDFAALLRWFQAAGLLDARRAASLERDWSGSPGAERVVEAARQLRERLRQDVLHWEAGRGVRRSTIAELNQLMADHPLGPKLTTELRLESAFEPQKPDDLFAPLAHAAATLFATADRARVRKCEHCILHFLDTSKKGTRRWCSMQLCGNRLKVAAYAARQREQKARY